MLRNAQKRAKQDAFFVRPDIAFVIGEFRRESQFDLITAVNRRAVVFSFHHLKLSLFSPLSRRNGLMAECQYFDSGLRSAWQEISFFFQLYCLVATVAAELIPQKSDE